MRFSEVLVYLAKRLLMAVFVLLLISILVFITVRLTPGDPVMNKIGPYGDASPENYQRVAAELGLDRPLTVQYLVWLKNCIKPPFASNIAFFTLFRPCLTVSEAIFHALPKLAIMF